MVKLIIFDYDGVIVNSFANVHEVYKIICEKLNKSCPEDFEDFKKIYGRSSSECYSQLDFSEEERIKGNMIFKDEILKKESKPFEKIVEVLNELHKNYKLAVISSSYKEEVKQKLEKLGILGLFDLVLANESYVVRFEKAESIKKAKEYFRVNFKDILLVGDRAIDYIEGLKAGLKNILLVDYGWGYNISEIPEYRGVLVNEPIDILSALKKY